MTTAELQRQLDDTRARNWGLRAENAYYRYVLLRDRVKIFGLRLQLVFFRWRKALKEPGS